MTKKRVKGTRTCHQCKTICHEDSFRKNYGNRKIYFCSEHCLRVFLTNKTFGKHRYPKPKIPDKDFNEFFLRFYDKVDVIE